MEKHNLLSLYLSNFDKIFLTLQSNLKHWEIGNSFRKVSKKEYEDVYVVDDCDDVEDPQSEEFEVPP